MARTVIHLTVADFPIAVEEVMEPRLRGRPAAVAVQAAGRSLILSASAEARRQGVFRGLALSDALKRCRDLTVLPPNPDLYARADAAVLQLLQHYSPLVEPLRSGQVYLDMTGSDRLFGSAADAAVRAQHEIRDRLCLQANAGVAGNKLVSKVASDVVTSAGRINGLCDVRAGGEPDFLAPLEVAFLPGVRGSVRRQLAALNIRLIRELAAVSSEHLQMAFGRFGLVLYQRSRGIDNRPVQPPRRAPQIVESETLEPDCNDYALLRRALYRLADRAAWRLRRKALLARRVALELRYSDYKENRVQLSLPPTVNDTEWGDCLEEALTRAVQRRVRVRTLTLRLLDLHNRPLQLSLFEPQTPPRLNALTAAMDRIRTRYGQNAIRFGRAA
ncbi:hypothetical protein JW992_01195 [candidate division KSB1 bacterium]|nr:hypothetical protein [candidate division KSB1 bacterium]